MRQHNSRATNYRAGRVEALLLRAQRYRRLQVQNYNQNEDYK